MKSKYISNSSNRVNYLSCKRKIKAVRGKFEQVADQYQNVLTSSFIDTAEEYEYLGELLDELESCIGDLE